MWLLLAGFMAGCSRPKVLPQKPSPQPKHSERLEVRTEGFRLTMPDEKGRLLWEAQVGSLEGEAHDMTEAKVSARDVRCTFYRNRKPSLTARAPRMEMDSESRQVILSGGVTACSTEDKADLKVETLTYNGKTHQAIGRGGFLFSQSRIAFAGDAFNWDLPGKKVECLGEPRFEWKPVKGKLF